MIKHIVMWSIKEVSGLTKKETALQMKQALEALNGEIEGLLALEVGIDFLQSEASYDVVLYSKFETKEALAYYQTHPLHVKVATDVVKQLPFQELS